MMRTVQPQENIFPPLNEGLWCLDCNGIAADTVLAPANHVLPDWDGAADTITAPAFHVLPDWDGAADMVTDHAGHVTVRPTPP
jgi:hypothetical protein